MDVRCFSMKKLFEQLEKEMFAVNPAMKEALAPGMERADIEAYIRRLPFSISSDIINLYEWSSGAGYHLEILPDAFLLPLEEGISEFEDIYPMKDELQGIFFQPYFDGFRFLGDWSDGGYSFGRIDSPSEGRIVGLCIHDNWRIAYNSLSDLLPTAIECYKRGVFANPDMPDFKMYFKIGKELNAPLEYWD